MSYIYAVRLTILLMDFVANVNYYSDLGKHTFAARSIAAVLGLPMHYSY